MSREDKIAVAVNNGKRIGLHTRLFCRIRGLFTGQHYWRTERFTTHGADMRCAVCGAKQNVGGGF